MGSKIHQLYRGNKPVNVRGHHTGNSSVSTNLSLLCATANLYISIFSWNNQYFVLMNMLCYNIRFWSGYEAFCLGNILLCRSDCKSYHCRIGLVEGSWMIGIIDEIRMPIDGISFQPILVDTKTRVRPTIPSEAQKRNGRFTPYCFFHIHLMKLQEVVLMLF